MLKKKSVNKGKSQKVSFYTHKLAEASTVYLVGDFNDWNETSHSMEKLKDGRFKLDLTLDSGKEYQFRYLVDGEWHNDWEADKYVPNPFFGDNSVVQTTSTAE
ncbi:MAG: isoamylase early set domain-containing protein [bacterium]|nr:isoamylase early set domain-containing protein [bacterium]